MQLVTYLLLSCSLCALKYYSDESLSVAMETRKDKVIGCVLAQLSTALLVSLNDKESRQVICSQEPPSVLIEQRCGVCFSVCLLLN